MARNLKPLAALPPFVLAVAAAGLVASALFGSGDVPEQARTFLNPAPANLVAPAPEELSSAVVARDWREVGSSPSTPNVPPVDPPKGPPKPPKPAKPPK